MQFVPRDEFLEYIRSNTEAHLEIVKILSMDIGRCYEVLKEMSQLEELESRAQAAGVPDRLR